MINSVVLAGAGPSEAISDAAARVTALMRKQ